MTPWTCLPLCQLMMLILKREWCDKYACLSLAMFKCNRNLLRPSGARLQPATQLIKVYGAEDLPQSMHYVVIVLVSVVIISVPVVIVSV